jgi:hypothetical protein
LPERSPVNIARPDDFRHCAHGAVSQELIQRIVKGLKQNRYLPRQQKGLRMMAELS